MKYLLLIYTDEAAAAAAQANVTPEEQAAQTEVWYDYGDWLTEKGWMRGGDALKDVDSEIRNALTESFRNLQTLTQYGCADAENQQTETETQTQTETSGSGDEQLPVCDPVNPVEPCRPG